jgi:histidinol dehydrogenase
MRILDWKSLTASDRHDALRRPAQRDAAYIAAAAQDIIDTVRREGDAALLTLTEKFDGIRLNSLRVTPQEFSDAERALNAGQIAAIERAISNVRRFHAAQGAPPLRVETAPGVVCERISVPIRAVGLYVPAGSAPLPSTAIMLAVPAAIAACPVRVMCTPPARHGGADPAVLVAARMSGVEQVFKAGGAQAIAAMAYGTATIPKCDKVFGPGNAWVTAAKLLVAQDPAGAAPRSWWSRTTLRAPTSSPPIYSPRRSMVPTRSRCLSRPPSPSPRKSRGKYSARWPPCRGREYWRSPLTICGC